ELLDEVSRSAATEAAEAGHDLVGVVAEDVAHDLLPVLDVHLAEVAGDAALVLAQGARERGGAGRVLRVGLDPAEQRREGLLGGLSDLGLRDAVFPGELTDRDLAQDLVVLRHAYLPWCRRP